MSMQGPEQIMEKSSFNNHQSEFLNVSGAKIVLHSLTVQAGTKLTLCKFVVHSQLSNPLLELLNKAKCTLSLAGLWSEVFKP